jgi:hypothetical protein
MADPTVVEGVMQCPAAQSKFEAIRAMLEGRKIKSMEFTAEVDAVGILLRLNDGHKVLVSMPELSLMMLLRDPDIGRQEQDLYYTKHVYRIPRRRKKRRRGQ